MAKIMLLGAAGFIGTNLAIKLAEDDNNEITLVDKTETFLKPIKNMNLKNTRFDIAGFEENTDFNSLLNGQEVVYHLVSTTVPGTSNQQIPQELMANVVVTSKMLEACVRCGVKKIVFISSGGTVYGNADQCPLKEDALTYPISSYGVQKVTIEKLLYLYRYMYGLDYRVVRLANPYGPFQRPNGIQGAVTTFTYKALKGEEITVYGDGTVVRDYIYIEDAIRGILKIADGNTEHLTFNLGCGYGTSIKEVLDVIQEALAVELNVVFMPGRKVDVPKNYLDITRYENAYGKLNPISLYKGILRTADYILQHYGIEEDRGL